MSIQTLIVIPKHANVAEVGKSLIDSFGAANFTILARYNANHKIIELNDADGVKRLFDVFLNSYAADDYADIYSGESTLIALHYNPSVIAAIERFAESEQAFLRRHDGASWESANTQIRNF